ncbi:MAG: carboxypeptidase regulatory-like domain-containing protein [Bryobacteraceae bacterium]
MSLVVVSSAMAQRTTANLYGSVLDPSRAAVRGAAIQVRNESTGATLFGETNERGEFAIAFIPPGTYSVEASAAGFKTFSQRGLQLAGGEQARFPVSLELGIATEQVTVAGEAALLQDTSPALNDRLTRTQVAELPQSRRDFTQLLILEPGMRASGQGLISFNGLAAGGTTVNVDGVDGAGDVETNSTSMFNNFNFINVMSQEAISEVNVSKGAYSADTGRSFGGNINVISRGGTNDFHGSLFHNWQNNVLNARFAQLAPSAAKPPVRFNQFGGSFGGPLVRDRLFFFGVYEGYRQSSFLNIVGQVPTPELKRQAGAAVPAYTNILGLWPNPTDPYPANGATGLYRGAGANTASDNHAVARVDYNISNTYRLAVRYRRGRPDQTIPSVVPANPRIFTGVTESGNVTLTQTGKTWSGETRFGLNYNDTARGEGLYLKGEIPSIAVQGAFSAGAELLINRGYAYSLEQIFQRTFGRHVLKFGGIYFDRNPRRFDEEVPIFTYPSVAALLQNRPSAVRVTFGQPDYKGHAWETGVFLQDDVRVRRNLIVNLGLRYEYFSVYKDATGHLYNPDGIAGAVSVPPKFRPKDRILEPDRNNFAPRIGFAWTVDSQSRNVIRSGFGMAYAPFSLRTFASSHYLNPDLPFRFNFGQSDVTAYDIRFPMTNEDFAKFVNGNPIPRSYVTSYAGMRTPKNFQWSLDYQRRLTSSLTLQTGYVGNKATNVSMTHSLNQPDYVTGLRPFPQALTFTYRDDADFSYYHAWQTSLRKRLGKGLTANAHYTWSRTMAISNGDFWLGNDLTVQDENNWRADLGPTNLDLPHNFAADFVYQLPAVGRDRGLLRHLVGGWQAAGIFTASSGTPLNILESSNRPSSRPDYAGGAVYADRSDRYQWLNARAFAQVPIVAASGGTIRPGNVGKNWLRAPSRWNVDLSLAKSFALADRWRLQVRAEAFNGFNNVPLNAPVSDVRNSAFGRILSVGEARRMQLNAKLTF